MAFGCTALFVLLVFWRPQEWLVPWLYGWPMLDAIMGAALLALLIEVDNGRTRFPRESLHLRLLGGLAVAGMMSHVAHTYLLGLIQNIPLLFKLTFFTVLLTVTLDRLSRLRVIAWLFVTMSAVMAVHAILQETRGYGFAESTPILTMRPGGEPYTRSFFFGIFEDPNDLAQILVTSLPFCFVLTYRRNVMSWLLGAGLAWLLVAGTLTTQSRGGLVALAMVAGMTAVQLMPARWMPVLLSLLVLGALALCPLSAGYLDASAHDRVVFWGQANYVFKTTPLFGVGLSMFSEYIEGDMSAHNGFVLCYTEIGIFGYWFWFGLIQLGILGAWRVRMAFNRPRNPDEAYLKRFAAAAVTAMAGYLGATYFLGRSFIFPIFFLFAILGAVPLIAQRLLPDDAPPLLDAKRDIFLWGTVTSMSSIVYIYASIVLLNKAYYG